MYWSSYSRMMFGEGAQYKPCPQHESVKVVLENNGNMATAKAVYQGREYLTLRAALALSREGSEE